MYTTGQQKSNMIFSRKTQLARKSSRHSSCSVFFIHVFQTNIRHKRRQISPNCNAILRTEPQKKHFCIYTGRRARDILFCKRIPREEQTFLSAPFPPAVPVGLAQGVEAREHKACQGQDGANTDHECEGLVQKDMGGEHCHHGHKIDIDRGLQGAEHANGKAGHWARIHPQEWQGASRGACSAHRL